MINVITIAVFLGVGIVVWKLKTMMPIIGTNVKEHIFTTHAVVIAVLYNVVFYGMVHWYLLYKINSEEGGILHFSTILNSDGYQEKQQTNKKGK